MFDYFFDLLKKVKNEENFENKNFSKEFSKNFYKLKEILFNYKNFNFHNHNYENEFFLFNFFESNLVTNFKIENNKNFLFKNKYYSLFIELFNSDDNNINKNSIILEIKSGTGGEESNIFVNDLFQMYNKFCLLMNFELKIIDFSLGFKFGYKDIIINLKGINIFDWFKYESGVHRVQRIPKTETQGRIHTSTVSVFVYPEINCDDFVFNENELRIDVFRSGGPGGQSVNTTDSAVRITHLPTKISVQCQDEKSQHKNKEKALKVLKSKIYNRYLEDKKNDLDKKKKNIIKTSERSEKIRTYNYSHDKCIDHRFNITYSNLNKLFSGNFKDFVLLIKQTFI